MRTVDVALANNGPGNYDYATAEILQVGQDESRNWDAYSLACEPGVPEPKTVSNPIYELHQIPTASDLDDNLYDNKDALNKERGQQDQNERHIYDRANYNNGESLYDNRM